MTRARRNKSSVLGTATSSRISAQIRGVAKRVPKVVPARRSPRRVVYAAEMKREENEESEYDDYYNNVEEYGFQNSENNNQDSDYEESHLPPTDIKVEQNHEIKGLSNQPSLLDVNGNSPLEDPEERSTQGFETNTQDMLPDPDDPDFHCRVCRRGYPGLGKYRTHIRHIHKMKLKPLKGLDKDSNIIPEEEDPNNYCRSCEKPLKNRSSYRSHLVNVHKMVVKPILKSTHVVNSIEELPEIDDPNFYCRVCDKSFDSRKYYRHHATFVHSMVLLPQKNVDDPNVLPDENDPENYCLLCDIFLSSGSNFKRHLEIKHKMTVTRPAKVSKINRDVLPEVDDPNFYCRSCDRTLYDQNSYRIHLRRIHKMTLTPLKQDPSGVKHVLPDVNDPDFYCRVCDRMFFHKYHYRRHLRGTHKIQTVALHKCAPNPDILPDNNDPNFYCRSCDRKFTNSGNFHRHLQQIHKTMEHTPQSRMNPDIIPDKDDPNFFCQSCDKPYNTRAKYRTHLSATHKIKLSKVTLPIFDPNYEGDPNDPSNTYCFICKKLYSRRDLLLKHIERIHEGNKKLVILPQAKVNPDIMPDINDPNFHCASCQFTFKHKGNYQNHLYKLHNIEIKRVRPVLNLDIIPDVNNSNHYCTSCKFQFKSRPNFVTHIKLMHKMSVPTLPTSNGRNLSIKMEEGEEAPLSTTEFNCNLCETIHISKRCLVLHMKKSHNIITKALVLNCRPKPSIQPDTDDPNNTHCKSCNYTFDSADIQRKHLIDLHGLQLPALDTDVMTIVGKFELDDPTYCYCRICDHFFAAHRQLLTHSRDFHAIGVKVETRRPMQKNDVVPDLDDPNSYCRACDSKFAERHRYCGHLRGTHGIIAKNPYDTTVPDYNDPNFFCNSCKIRHTTYNNYRNHLILHHNYRGQVTKEEEGEAEEENDGLLPDPNDPNFHCNLCNFTYSTRIAYQKHLVDSHKMFVPRLGKSTLSKDQIQTSDIINPNAYCRSCKRSFESVSKFRRHVRVIHYVITPKTIHSVNAANRCIACNITFVNAEYLGGHMNKFHEEDSSGDDTNNRIVTGNVSVKMEE